MATAIALALFGLAQRTRGGAICACLIAGASWTVVLTNLYVSAQIALPDWVRGRGLAIFLTVIFGATTVGSAVWGNGGDGWLAQLAGRAVSPFAHFVAAAGVMLAIPLDLAMEAADRRRRRSHARPCIGARRLR